MSKKKRQGSDLPCFWCNGTGWTNYTEEYHHMCDPCDTCEGTGRITYGESARWVRKLRWQAVEMRYMPITVKMCRHMKLPLSRIEETLIAHGYPVFRYDIYASGKH